VSLKGLDGKSLIITGGASGIGLAAVKRLLSEGSSITVVDVNPDAITAMEAEIGTGKVASTVGDVADEADVARVFQAALDAHGRVDGIFNNAAITTVGSLAETDPAELDRVFRTNVRGPFLGTRAMINWAVEHDATGVVVNAGSSLALQGTPNHGVYCAAKAAVLSLTRTAAQEGARVGVRVNAVLPGPTITPLLLAQPKELLDIAAAANPMGRFAEAEEVASVAAWLLSDESSYVNGGLYLVDGGEQA